MNYLTARIMLTLTIHKILYIRWLKKTTTNNCMRFKSLILSRHTYIYTYNVYKFTQSLEITIFFFPKSSQTQTYNCSTQRAKHITFCRILCYTDTFKIFTTRLVSQRFTFKFKLHVSSIYLNYSIFV